MKRPVAQVVWFTGLSGAGKSTLCRFVEQQLTARMYAVRVLDGDEIRKGLSPDLDYSMSDRREHVRRVTYCASTLAECGIIVLVAVTTPLNSMRRSIRENIPGLLEVFADAPLAVCEERDVKGLYKRAREGMLPEITGLDSLFERPEQSDVVCRTDIEDVAESGTRVLEALLTRTRINADSCEPSKRKLTIAVDFDGVIADYQGWEGHGSFGLPREDVIQALRALRTEGWKIVVHTARSANTILDYLKTAGVPYDEINKNSDYPDCVLKPVATVYWDDRAIRYSGDAQQDLAIIRNFRTWTGRK